MPSTNVVLCGDFNSHVQQPVDEGGGTMMCGELHDSVLGKSYEGDCSSSPLYTVLRCSQNTVRVHKPEAVRGAAVHRTCRDYGLLLLNGRARSDRFGAYTYRAARGQGDVRSVLDLAIVPREAVADLRVATVQQAGQSRTYHRCLLITLAGPAAPENGEDWNEDTCWTRDPVARARTPSTTNPAGNAPEDLV